MEYSELEAKSERKSFGKIFFLGERALEISLRNHGYVASSSASQCLKYVYEIWKEVTIYIRTATCSTLLGIVSSADECIVHFILHKFELSLSRRNI
jgi:hypothetical protein